MASFESLRDKVVSDLQSSFGDAAAEEFVNVLDEFEMEDVDEVKADIEDADLDKSSIVKQMAEKLSWSVDDKVLFFEKIRVWFGLETRMVLPSSITWTQFNDAQCDDTRDYINKQCFNAFSGFDQSFITIETIGRNHGVNLVPLLFDIYSFHKFSKKTNATVTHSQFCAKSTVLSKLNKKDKAHSQVYQSLVQTLSSFQHRINPSFNPNYMLKIDDDINIFIEYTLMVSRMLNSVVQKPRDWSPFPLLVDFWIIPNKVREAMATAMDDDDDDDEEDEDDEDDDEDEVKEDMMTKDFKANLSKFIDSKNIQTATINFKDSMSQRKLSNAFERILNKSRRSVKINIVIDLRKDSDNLLIYQLPLKYSAIPQNYCNETLIYSSAEHIMYDTDNSILKQNGRNDENKEADPIFGAKYDCDGKMFCLSYALHEADKTRIQFWKNGGGVRFWPNYMMEIWPKLFANPKLDKKFSEKYIDENFQLNVKDPLFEAWYDAIVDF